MNSTLTLRRAIVNGRLWYCALLMVYAMTAANLCSLGSTIMRDGTLKKAFSQILQKKGFDTRVHAAQNSIVKSAKSDEVHLTLAVLTICMLGCAYLQFYVSVPAAVRYRLASYLKRFFENLAMKRRASALSNDTRLGDLLVACKIITPEELKEALEAGGGLPEKSGETLVRLGHITDQQLESALAIQAKLQKRACRREKALAWLTAVKTIASPDDKAAFIGSIVKLRGTR